MGTKVYTDKSSIKVFGDNTEDVIAKARSRAILTAIKNDEISYWKEYVRQIVINKGRIKGFYRYAEKGHYPHGLPSFEIRGISYQATEIEAALNTEFGGTNHVIFAYEDFPDIDTFIKHSLQATPTFYQPYINMLTHNGKTDWYIKTIEFTNTPVEQYDISIERRNADALFWIEGPGTVTEGRSIEYTIRSNIMIPKNCSVDINLTYSGTLAGTEYTAVPTVTMNELELGTTFSVPISSDTTVESTETLICTISSVTDTNLTFKSAGPDLSFNSVTTTVYDDDAIILSMDDVIVNEADTSVTIPVTLGQATAGAFTADYAFADGTALGGTEYDNTAGQLSFAGTAGEVQNIVVTLSAPVDDASTKDFTVSFTACSDPAVIITRVAKVTITSDNPYRSPLVFDLENDTIIHALFDDSVKYLISSYYTDPNPDTQWYYWLYDVSDPTYTFVSDVNTANVNDMIPVTILRREKVSLNVDKTTNEYKRARHMLKFLSMKIDDVIDNLESNPDIADVDDCFVNFSIAPSDNDPDGILSHILWEHFYRIVVDFILTPTGGGFWLPARYETFFVEADVNNESSWSDQSYTNTNVGVKTTVGGYLHEIIPYNELEFSYQDDSPATRTRYRLHIYFQDSANNYQEIVLTDLQSKSKIVNNGHTRYELHELQDAAMTIPISWGLIDILDPKDVLKVYQHIFRIDIYAIVVVHLDWYETAFFITLFQFLAVVITISSLGTGSSLVALAQQIAINALVIRLVVYIAQETGNAELAAIVGVVVSVALGANGFSSIDLGTAQGLTDVVTGFSDTLTAAQEGVAKGDQEYIEGIQAETEFWKEKLEDQEKLGGHITGEFYNSLIRSNDTLMYMSGEAQYNYDSVLTGGYDRLITAYHDNMLQSNIV